MVGGVFNTLSFTRPPVPFWDLLAILKVDPTQRLDYPRHGPNAGHCDQTWSW
jgi:hypothetical protein